MSSDQALSQNNYQVQLDSKIKALKKALNNAGIAIPKLSIYSSAPQGF